MELNEAFRKYFEDETFKNEALEAIQTNNLASFLSKYEIVESPEVVIEFIKEKAEAKNDFDPCDLVTSFASLAIVCIVSAAVTKGESVTTCGLANKK